MGFTDWLADNTSMTDFLIPGSTLVYNKFFRDPAAKKEAALKDASVRSREMADNQRAFQMEGMNKALDKLKPAEAAYRALYGDPASWRL